MNYFFPRKVDLVCRKIRAGEQLFCSVEPFAIWNSFWFPSVCLFHGLRRQGWESGEGIAWTPEEGKGEEVELGDTWVCPCAPSLQGWGKSGRASGELV